MWLFFVTVKLLAYVCVCVCVCGCVRVRACARSCVNASCVTDEKVFVNTFFFFLLLLFYSYVYVGCPKFSPNTADILTNITCYIVNNTLIKDATLSVWNAWFILLLYRIHLKYYLTYLVLTFYFRCLICRQCLIFCQLNAFLGGHFLRKHKSYAHVQKWQK